MHPATAYSLDFPVRGQCTQSYAYVFATYNVERFACCVRCYRFHNAAKRTHAIQVICTKVLDTPPGLTYRVAISATAAP